VLQVYLNDVPAYCNDCYHDHGLETNLSFLEVDFERFEQFQAEEYDQHASERLVQYFT